MMIIVTVRMGATSQVRLGVHVLLELALGVY